MKDAPLNLKVYKSLHLDIISGKLPGGTKVTAAALAKSLKIDRMLIEEALQRLSEEKLLIQVPDKEYIVEILSDNEIQDLFSTRMEIEQIVIQKAIEHITGEELNSLSDNLKQIKAAIKSGEHFKLTELDIAFHTIIYKAAKSESLFRVCKNLSDLTIKYRHGLNLAPNIWSELLEQHIKLYEAFVSKNKDKAAQAIEAYSQHTRSHLVDTMKKVRSNAAVKKDVSIP